MIILRTETEAKLSGKNRTEDTRKYLQTNEPNNKLQNVGEVEETDYKELGVPEFW
jgi:hypothetical protein